jgi:hypothetical protein
MGDLGVNQDLEKSKVSEFLVLAQHNMETSRIA